MTEPTSRPWTVRDDTNVMAGRRLVANTGGYQTNVRGSNHVAENHANARLIAAAPDLYEFVEGVARGPYPDSDLASLMETYRCRARALLDKIRD